MSPHAQGHPLSIAVLISGSGSTLRNLLDRIEAGELPATVQQVISSNPKARGLDHATRRGIETRIVRPQDFPSPAEFSHAVFEPFRQANVGLVVMGGYLKLLPIPPDFENRVMNIHPGLIPDFCGRGFYGQRVHQAVLDCGAKTSGCTVHFVDNEYDHGPIILRRTVDVSASDTPESLQERVFDQECEAYPEAIRLYAKGCLRVVNRRVVIQEPENGS